MTTENKKAKSGETGKTFVCKYCQKTKPFSDIVVVTEYFPALVVCSECAKNVR